jgi:hypothetical protein
MIAAASASEPNVAFDPVFECYRVNTAWGFAMSGAAIGHDGVIKRYRLIDTDMRPAPIHEDDMTYVDASRLRARVDAATASGSVDTDKLRDNIALIEDAAKGHVSTVITGVRDAGTSSCHAYVFDGDKQRYRDIDLGSDGAVSDTRWENDAKAAATILEWLKSSGVAIK